MLEISLTQGKVAIVGPRDYTFLVQWKWCYHYGYAVRTNYTNGKQRTILMHRIILERMGYKNFTKSDHINRNTLDNRRYNLRPATDSQSAYNRNKQKSNASGYIGVYWHKRRWHANIKVNRKSIFLEYYNDPKEAAKIYNEAALKYHGKFAVLNKV
jgi:hypothetical protein